MNIKIMSIKIVGTLAMCLCLSMLMRQAAHAQSFRYIDEAGNIFFVDSVDEIPSQYKSQILGPATPIPQDLKSKGKKNKVKKTKKPKIAKTEKKKKSKKGKGSTTK